MSVRVSMWVWHDLETDVDHPMLLVLLALADEADDNGGSCFPSLRRMAGKCRMSTSGVRQVIGRLESSGLIVVVRPDRQGRGHHNRYELLGPFNPATSGQAVLDGMKDKSASGDTFGEKRAEGSKTGDKSAQKRAPWSALTLRPKPLDPRPVSERRDWLDAEATAELLADVPDDVVDASNALAKARNR